jgi:large subunit ribosomal protein L3
MTLPANRTGVIAKKLGMTRFFDETGQHVPVTVLSLDGCQVTAQRTVEKDGYTALQLGAGAKKPKNTPNGHAWSLRQGLGRAQAGRRRVPRRRNALIEVGAELTADHYVAGQKVDIQGVTVGKGFAGAMKRWNFGGLRATHGVSVSHRSHGSTGNRQDPGRTFKGKKMAGHLGQETVTTLNVTVWKVDVERGLILIKGAVPGHEGSYVKVRDAIKKAAPADLPRPGAFRKAGQAPVAAAAETPAEEAPAATTEEGEG